VTDARAYHIEATDGTFATRWPATGDATMPLVLAPETSAAGIGRLLRIPGVVALSLTAVAGAASSRAGRGAGEAEGALAPYAKVG
jgi:hypothetical protein